MESFSEHLLLVCRTYPALPPILFIALILIYRPVMLLIRKTFRCQVGLKDVAKPRCNCELKLPPSFATIHIVASGVFYPF